MCINSLLHSKICSQSSRLCPGKELSTMSFMLGQHTPTANVHRHNRTFRDQAPGVPGTVLTDDGPGLLSNNLHAHAHTHRVLNQNPLSTSSSKDSTPALLNVVGVIQKSLPQNSVQCWNLSQKCRWLDPKVCPTNDVGAMLKSVPEMSQVRSWNLSHKCWCDVEICPRNVTGQILKSVPQMLLVRSTSKTLASIYPLRWSHQAPHTLYLVHACKLASYGKAACEILKRAKGVTPMTSLNLSHSCRSACMHPTEHHLWDTEMHPRSCSHDSTQSI